MNVIFSHLLIVTSRTSLVPYGFTVLNGCLVIGASIVMSPCIALLNVELSCSFYTFFESFSLGGGDCCIFLLTLKIFHCLGK